MSFFTEERIFGNWKLILSLIPGAGIITVLSLKTNIQVSHYAVLPLFLQGILGVVVGAFLFAPKWSKLPIKTENEFILYRYSDPFVKPLYYFRAFYLGLVIIPLLIHISVSSVFNASLFPSTIRETALSICWIMACFITFFNNLKNRVFLDAATGAVNLAFMFTYVLASILYPSENTNLMRIDTMASLDLLLILGCFWWMNNIIDMPDMRAQKLLVLKSRKSSTAVILVPVVFVFLFEVFLVWGPSNSFIQPWMIQFLIMLNLIQIISSMQHWSGGLTSQASLRLFANGTDVLKIKQYLFLLFPLILSILWSYFLKSTADALIAFFGLTAGVGPVYILRWYYWRINALTQLVAMVGPMVISLILLVAQKTVIYQGLLQRLPFDKVYSSLLVAASLNILLWLPTLFMFSKNRMNVQSLIQKL